MVKISRLPVHQHLVEFIQIINFSTRVSTKHIKNNYYFYKDQLIHIISKQRRIAINSISFDDSGLHLISGSHFLIPDIS